MSDARDIAKMVFENAGREITQSFEVQNSNMALVAGVLAAILTVLGAGELFTNQKHTIGGIPKLSTTSLMVLTLALPLVFRFFVRSLIAYQNLLRFNSIQRCAWRFLNGEESEDAFLKYQEIYWTNWQSPRSFSQLVKENLKYGYFWVFVASFTAFSWAFYCSSWLWGRLASLPLLAIAVIWEWLMLKKTRYFVRPSEDELLALQALRRPVSTQTKD